MSYLELLCGFILHFCKCTKNLFSVVQMFCLQDVLFLRTIITIIAYRVELIFFNLFLVVLVLCYIEVYVISKYSKTSFHKTRYQYVHVFKNCNSTANANLCYMVCGEFLIISKDVSFKEFCWPSCERLEKPSDWFERNKVFIHF